MKRNLCLLILAVFTKVSLLSAASPSMADVTFKKHVNPRFGFSIEYPDIFKSLDWSQNQDGVMGESSDGEYTFSVFGSYNVMNNDGHKELESAKERVSKILPDSEKSGADFFTITCSDDGGADGNEHYFYEYGSVTPELIIGFVLRYPAEQQTEFVPIIERMKNSIKRLEVSISQDDNKEYKKVGPDLYLGEEKLEDVSMLQLDNEEGLYYTVLRGEKPGTYFFKSEGAPVFVIPMNKEDESQFVEFAPHDNLMVLVSDTGDETTWTYDIYDIEKRQKVASYTTLFGEFSWLDQCRFVMTKIDQAANGEEVDRLSVIVYDVYLDHLITVKEATANKNFSFDYVDETKDKIYIIQENIKDRKNAKSAKGNKTKSIKVDVPAAG